ncbi:MAG: FecR domain-containing protein [Chitinophagaceae bacterium]|nr:FecR domain-containing protein [Chitinophagaceae bacterium]
MAHQPLIEELLIKQLDQPLTAAEQAIVDEWLQASPQNRELYNSIYDKEQLESKLTTFRQFDETASWEKLVASGRWAPATQKSSVIRSIQKKWYYAAAVIMLAAGSGIFYLYTQEDKPGQGNAGLAVDQREIVPGKNQAILQVGDSVINLNDNKTGVVAQGNAIAYNDGQKIAGANQLITLTTPRGGQYTALLPDGSKVWLNAASSIKFPSKFSNEERAVSITGEVYFEVAQQHKTPFLVKAGNTNVQVLGTSFNINAYDNEKVIRTTLAEGSVRVAPVAPNGSSTVLKPGQQAVSTGSGEITGVYSPDLSNVLAWKNGFFSFSNADIETVMRQLERWYDIKVEYRGAIPTVKLNGELDRQIPLSDVLRYLSRLNIKYEREGRTISILPQ